MRRARLFALGALLLVTPAACGGGSSAPVGPAVTQRQIEVDGTSRTYRLYTPPAIDDDRPMPLVLALHGANNKPEDFARTTSFDQAASAGRFVVAYPEAQRLVWNGGFCCTTGRGDPGTDVRFLDRLIADVSSTVRIDLARVYAVGVSAGGIMAYRLACDLAGRIAGVGAVAAGMQLDDCRPSRPVSALVIHGTGDQLVPFEGGRVQGGAIRPVPPTPAVADAWASMDRCAPPAEPQVDGIVTTTTWARCDEGAQVRFIRVEGGGHNWFDATFGLPNGAIDATASVVEFFGLS
ncbi:MAG TPA: PHB depolymerase family esterase [Acidimicrobiales bacterium]|nr:PHB depolymerase family esterase [Acidimicrobiales bacterium]